MSSAHLTITRNLSLRYDLRKCSMVSRTGSVAGASPLTQSVCARDPSYVTMTQLPKDKLAVHQPAHNKTRLAQLGLCRDLHHITHTQ